ncbi:MAG: hypothetical protein ABI140_08840 [Jatrophihabitantaceae bacterium]
MAATVVLLAATALAVPSSAAPATSQQAGTIASTAAVASHNNNGTCNIVQRGISLAVEQARVLKLLKGHTVLRNQADLDAMAGLNPSSGIYYALLPHMFDSMAGIGLTIVNVGAGGPGVPNLLFYKPNKKATNLLDPFGADYPYTLDGWGYVSPYTPGTVPSFGTDPGLRCLNPTDWLIHERSVHPSDTWQNIALPPTEQWRGQDAGATPPTAQECSCPVGLNHGRFWDVHFFLDGWPVPLVQMLNPGKRIPGFDSGIGFFYPQYVPNSAGHRGEVAVV